MSDFLQDKGLSGGSAAQTASASDYRVREAEARLDRRLAAIELQHQRTGWAAGFTVVTLVVALAALVVGLWAVVPHNGTRTVDSLSTKEVVLRDSDGVERGRFGTGSDGQTRLSISDRDGRERIRLTVLSDGSPGVTISDPDGHPRAVLGYLSDGTTNLVFADADGTSRAVVGLEPDGSAQVLFADHDGTIRTLVGVGADGAPSVSTFEGKSEAASRSP